jgi:diguanylate cyclase (GGDEF)-like protein
MQNPVEKQHLLAIIVDYFIHPRLRADSDMFYRARILIAAILAFLVVCLSSFLAVPLINFTQSSILIAGGLLLPTAFCFITLLILLRQNGSYLFCAVATVSLLLLLIVGGICVSGGVAHSPVTQLLVVPPLTAYFFGGVRWGSQAVFSTFMLLVGMIGLHFLGIDFIQTVNSSEQIVVLHLLVSFVNLSAISGMAFIYEFTAAALKRERDLEREKYVRLAKTDPLTGLANRRNFDAMLQERIELYAVQDPPRRFALGYLDLDGFKPVNDKLGHAVGDEVLRIVSERLRAVLRGSDFVGRHGGDEFMMMLDLAGEPEALEKMATRLLTAIAKPIKTSAGEVGVSGSLGFSIFPLDATDIEELKKFADEAMYAAKKQHNCWREYEKIKSGV